jgi:RNA polymerase-binding protein DksA
MTSERLEYYRSILLKRREFVLETIERWKDLSQFQDDEIELNKVYSDDFAEQAIDTIGKEESSIFLSREFKYLNRIDTALKSIEKGNYGKCKSCGKDISFERLRAVPTTDTCIKCKNSIVINRNSNLH